MLSLGICFGESGTVFSKESYVHDDQFGDPTPTSSIRRVYKRVRHESTKTSPTTLPCGCHKCMVSYNKYLA